MKIDGYSKHTHSLTHSHTLTRTCTSTHPPTPPPPTPPPTPTHPPPTHTHTHTQKIWGKGGGKGDSTDIHSIKLEITTLIENKKMEKKRSYYGSTYTWHQNSLIINFKKCAKLTNNRLFVLLQKRLKSINICIFTIKWWDFFYLFFDSAKTG